MTAQNIANAKVYYRPSLLVLKMFYLHLAYIISHHNKHSHLNIQRNPRLSKNRNQMIDVMSGTYFLFQKGDCFSVLL